MNERENEENRLETEHLKHMDVHGMHNKVNGIDDKDDIDLQEKKPNEVWEWVKALGVAVLIAVVIRVFLFAPIVVEGESMLPTLQNSERLIINKAVYIVSEPQRNDIVVFHATPSKDWIKRVIGEPGDIVEMRNGTMYVNGNQLEETYINGVQTSDFGPQEIPEGHIYVMGDNRPNSRDSRNIGSVEIDTVVGRAEVVFWPISELRLMKK